ncbi:uncharacterized protein LOC107465450 isoform X3 [Arachis duranensis]|uniref:Uncharacterized protein LOC107465450 isoform X3 n=1 Tax=Arachis duranensis TaxID=130453 RepID=A0A9C6TKU2_ARADU|nr:uncharacterized protein LOC107465450 isoform X3 [Arachis duranensis]
MIMMKRLNRRPNSKHVSWPIKLMSGCSSHMTGRSTFFIKLDEYDEGFATFDDNGKRKDSGHRYFLAEIGGPEQNSDRRLTKDC